MTEKDRAPASPGLTRRQKLERWLEVASVILLSITALVTAWSAYQAATWGSTMSVKFSQASTRRVLATRASTTAGQLTAIDINLFTNWLNAYGNDNTKLVEFYQARFRLEFVPAFEAWLAAEPRLNPDAPKSPFVMPEYQVSYAQEAAELDEEAARLYEEGMAANRERDGYAFTTVLLASILFFAGMAQRIKWFPLQVTMIGLGYALLVAVLVRLLTLAWI